MATVAELYDAEREAYYAYVKVASGSDLVLRSQRISDTKVAAAREEWHARLEALRAAGGTPEVVRDVLQERASETRKVKR